MAKVFGINTKIRGKVGEYIYRQTKVGTVVSEAPVKPITPLRTENALLKKVQALVAERIAREEGSGRKPSSH